MAQKFTTLDKPAAKQIAWWQEVLSEVYYNLEVYSDGRDGLRGEILEYDLDGLSLTRFSSDWQRVLRTSRRIAADDDDYVVVVFPRSKPMFYSQLGRSGVLDPGGYIVVHTRAFYELSCPDAFENLTVKIPSVRVRRHLPFIEDHCGCAYPNDRKMAAIVVSFADWLIQQVDRMPDSVRRAMGDHLIELTIAMLMGESGAPGPPKSQAALQLRRRIEAFVRERLVDPDLSAQFVADRFGISVSYLHRLFRPSGTSFWHWILSNRLQLAYEKLTHPGDSHSTVAQIAYSCGFSHQAHFSTLFRRRFATTPRNVRSAAQDAGGQRAWLFGSPANDSGTSAP